MSDLRPDPRWQACVGKTCRYTHCQGPAVAEFARSHGTQVRWWPYCVAHVEAYGCVIVASVVMRREQPDASDIVLSLMT